MELTANQAGMMTGNAGFTMNLPAFDIHNACATYSPLRLPW